MQKVLCELMLEKVLDTAKMGIWGNIMKLRYGDFIHFSRQNKQRISYFVKDLEKKSALTIKFPNLQTLKDPPLINYLTCLTSDITGKSHERE